MLLPRIPHKHFVVLQGNNRFFIVRYFELVAEHLFGTRELEAVIGQKLNRDAAAVERLLGHIRRVEPIGYHEACLVVQSLAEAIQLAGSEAIALDPRQEIIGAFFAVPALKELLDDAKQGDICEVLASECELESGVIKTMAEGYRVTLNTALVVLRRLNGLRAASGLPYVDPRELIATDPRVGKRGAVKGCLVEFPDYKTWLPQHLLEEDEVVPPTLPV